MLQDIWILNKEGNVLFHREFDVELEAQLFGALVSAMNTFIQEIATQSLKSFELKNTRFSFIAEKDFLFITSSSKKCKSKKILQQLETIKKKFFKSFPDSFFQNWDQDISCFARFKDEINNYLETPV
jgi:hypothetical protein